MDNIANVSSEEELSKLRNESKISDAEYGELLNAMHKPLLQGTQPALMGDDASTSKHKLGKIAIYLMLAGIIVPIVAFFLCFAITGGGDGDVIFSVFFSFACWLKYRRLLLA